jgi:DNA end-binding protein Ku
VQIRPAEGGLVLQQLLYAAEVRSHKELDIEKVDVSQAELQLALQLVDQISTDSYDPTEYVDEEKKRILAAIDEKIAGKQVVVSSVSEQVPATAQVIDLMEALRASLAKKPAAAKPAAAKAAPIEIQPVIATKERKSAKRGAATEAVGQAAPAKARARK